MQNKINDRQKSFKAFQISLSFSWSLRDSGSWKISKLEKPAPMFSCSLFRDNTLEPAYVWKYFEILYVKGQDKLQDTTVNS